MSRSISPFALPVNSSITMNLDRRCHMRLHAPPRSMPSRISAFCLLPETAGTCAETIKPPDCACSRSTPLSSELFPLNVDAAWVNVPCPTIIRTSPGVRSVSTINATIE